MSRSSTASGRSSSSTARTSTSSRAAAKSCARYFPELSFAPGRWVLDGELVIRDADGNLEFDLLQERIHPAQSRIELLSREIPAHLRRLRPARRGRRGAARGAAGRAAAAAGGDRRAGRPGADAADPRRRAGREVAGQHRGGDGEAARRPLPARQAQGDGEGQARADDRLRGDGLAAGQGGGHGRLADPRPLRRRRAAHASATSPASAPPRNAACGRCWRRWRRGESGSAEPSRWTGGRDLEWVALRPELVIEVGYDHAAGGRIRHGARFHRFRDDKDAGGSAGSSSWTKGARRGALGRRVLPPGDAPAGEVLVLAVSAGSPTGLGRIVCAGGSARASRPE